MRLSGRTSRAKPAERTTGARSSPSRTSKQARRLNSGVKIWAAGRYAPAAVLTNQDLEKILDPSDEWIVTRTGMQRRHIAAADEATSDLCIAAAHDALSRTTLQPSDIDCYIVATVTPDYPFPATACIVASKLG